MEDAKKKRLDTSVIKKQLAIQKEDLAVLRAAAQKDQVRVENLQLQHDDRPVTYLLT